MRVSEIYTSIQGEGPRVGQPTQFLRFGGCNLRCPGWPCDTQHAIDPKYRDEWERLSVTEVLDKIQPWPRHVCLTGGEPFLQPENELHRLVSDLWSDDFTVECFSNGTLPYPAWATEDVCCFVLDWKLPGSGEVLSQKANAIRSSNVRRLEAKDRIKFTIASEADALEAMRWYRLMAAHVHPSFIAGVVWGKDFTDKDLVQFILDNQLPWTMNVQVHNHIWDRSQRGI